MCGESFGNRTAYHAHWEPGLVCEKDRRSGMRPLTLAARQLAETFATERLDRIENVEGLKTHARELREAALDWIEHHTERRLTTRTLLETT
jgi:hypothetical protein